MYIENCNGELVNTRYIAYLKEEHIEVPADEAEQIEQNFIRCLTAVMLNGKRFEIGYFYDHPELERDRYLITFFWKEDINKNGTNTIYKTTGLTWDLLIEKVADRSYFKIMEG